MARGTNVATASIEIALDEISLGERRLRFIDWTSLKNLNLVSKTDGTHIPLFLGADVLAECPIAVANQPRTHAKFAKKGFATKVYFPQSVRIVDVHGTGRGLWFYTVQGLFRVAFELYTRHEQLECMMRLSNVWRDRYSDSLLKQDINIILGSEAQENSGSTSLVEKKALGRGTSLDSTKQVSTLDKEEQNPGNFASPQISAFENQRTQGLQDCPTSIMQLAEAFFNRNKERMTEHEKRMLHCLAEVLFEISQEYQHRGQNTHCEGEEEGVVLVISQWLGKKFHSYQSEIETKVTVFKERHISTIDNLPPAEQVVEELYPVCMRDFLLAWMGVDLSRGKQGRNTETLSLFPCIQLILELSNQILVSGVGHVLYSRLNKTDCV